MHSIEIESNDVARWEAVRAALARELTPRTEQEVEEEEEIARAFYGMHAGEAEQKQKQPEAAKAQPEPSLKCPSCFGTNLCIDDDLDAMCLDCDEYWALQDEPKPEDVSTGSEAAILRFRQAWNCIDTLVRSTVTRLDSPPDVLTLAYRQFTDWSVQAQMCDLGASEADYYST
mmetsp:Transcript_15856/g.34437  ORF Transcript_15856/g.34437 Transcript_15856/m.34437 type:complete len:173 (-) Transcript_15856:202-720(-)